MPRAILFAVLMLAASGKGGLHAAEEAPASKPPPSIESVPPESTEAVLGRTIVDSNGKDIGQLVDVLVDDVGRPRAGVIDFGGFLGVGARKIAVHWSALRFSPALKTRRIVLDMTPDEIKAAPAYDNPDKPSLGGYAGRCHITVALTFHRMHPSMFRRPGGHRALDWLNFFIADAQTGFGPFVAVYLTSQKWTQVEIGFALSLGAIVSMISQVPAGALVDAVRNKRAVASMALGALAISALLLAIWPARLPVLLAQMLHGMASCILTPSIAALSLGLAGHAALGERLGRNARFAAIGNGLAAAVLGATGAWLSSRAVFVMTAGLCIPALVALWLVPAGGQASDPAGRPAITLAGLRQVASDRRLMIFAVCVMLFHLSNAAMLPLAAAEVTMRAGGFANVIIGACIVVPQVVVALLSPWVGRVAAERGRRWILVLGWSALPVRALLLAVLPGAWPMVVGQAVSGLSAAVFGVMLPLLAADLTIGTRHFNLCLGFLGLAMYAGAAISTSLAGGIADAAGMQAAFVALGTIGAMGTLVIWSAMPETRPAVATVPP